MRDLFIFIFTVILLIGCNSGGTMQETVTLEKSEVIPTHVAILEVEGMMCEKGCGATIRRGLYETGGVSEVNITFDENKPMSEIKVYFDNHKVSVDDMIDVIGSLANKQYTAKLMKITESTISASMSEEKTLSNHKINSLSKKEVSTTKITFPNLTKLLNQLIN